jgi:cation:H+ antiporter
MDMWVSIGVGLVLLLAGGELLVRGAVACAKSLGVSPLLIGLTLVGFGTSTPELVTSVTAALNGSPGIAVGNVVGSNTANILLILGMSAIIYPLAVNPLGFKRDAIMLAVAAFACLAVVLYGRIGPLVGIGFIALLIAYVGYVYIKEKAVPDEAALVAEHRAEDARVGPSLTIVAVGTSMPELVTSIMAAIRKHADVAYGNIIGSNIFNVLFILGTTALIQPIEIPQQIANFDIWVMMAATGLLILFARTGIQLQRWEGVVFVAGYIGYTSYLISIA